MRTSPPNCICSARHAHTIRRKNARCRADKRERYGGVSRTNLEVAVPELSPATQQIIRRARIVIADALDEVHPRLLDDDTTLNATRKTDGTLVTAADLAVDDRLNSRLSTAFPDHGVLSEERNTTAPNTDWTWIIDPIDGTSNYACGLPYWCVSVALALEGEPVLGVIDAPVVGRRYVAARNEGVDQYTRIPTRMDDASTYERRPSARPLHVRDEVDWGSSQNRHIPLMLTTGTAKRARAAGIALKPRVMGSTALDLAAVATGAAAASVAVVPKVWDIAAGALLAKEAGGAILTPKDDALLPLKPGDDYINRSAMTMAGPNEAYLRRLADALELA